MQHPEYVQPFNLGVEVYLGTIGYHAQTIPNYVRQYDLKGLILIAKDEPWNALKPVFDHTGIPVSRAPHLLDLGSPQYVGIHYLPLQQVIVELDYWRDDLDGLLPRVPKQFDL